MVVKDPGFVDMQRVVLESMCSAYTIRHEWWHLRVMEAERDRLFNQIAAEAAQAVADVTGTNISSSTLFTPHRNNREAGPSSSMVNLTSTGDMEGRADSSKE